MNIKLDLRFQKETMQIRGPIASVNPLLIYRYEEQCCWFSRIRKLTKNQHLTQTKPPEKGQVWLMCGHTSKYIDESLNLVTDIKRSIYDEKIPLQKKKKKAKVKLLSDPLGFLKRCSHSTAMKA